MLPLFSIAQNTTYVEQDIPLSLPEGWSIFGYSCVEPIDATEALEPILDNVVIVKDSQGNAYLPTWNFNGIGDLEYSKGYQIKLLQEIIGFQFCAAIIPNINNELIFGCTYPIAINFSPDAIQDDGSCEFEIDPYWGDVIWGCIDAGAINFNEEAWEDDGSCEYISGCTNSEAPNYNPDAGLDDGSCILSGCTDENACNYDEDASIENGTCYYSEYEYCIGDIYQGGYVFQINDDGTGLIANLDVISNSSEINMYDAFEVSDNLISQGYDDWYLPSMDELYLLYEAIWPIAGLNVYSPYFLSSTEEISFGYSLSVALSFSSGESSLPNMGSDYLSLWAIRSFGVTNDTAQACPYDVYLEYNPNATIYNAELCQTLIIEGCLDSVAVNYNMEANTDDANCQYILGCTDISADNYNPDATQEDENCIYYGCMEVMAGNYNEQANQEDNSCIYYGCMNPTAENYDPNSNEDVGNCIIYGCTLDAFPNYNSAATEDDFSCDMNSNDVFGCTDENSWHYNPNANSDNGTCSLLPYVGMQAEGGIIFYIDETGEHGLVAAIEDLTNTFIEGMFNRYEWGCYGESVNGADGTSIGTGYQNTMDIVNQGCTTESGGITAAQATLDSEIGGYTDWYLPSRDELMEMYYTIGNGGSEGNIGNFVVEGGYYESSTEYDSIYEWTVHLSNGYTSGTVPKSSTEWVRAIRSF